MCRSFIPVAEEGADGTVKMRGWERKGRSPLVSKAEVSDTNRGAELGKQGWGKQGWVSRDVYRKEGARKDSLGARTLAGVDVLMHAELGLPFLHLPI